MVYMENDFCLLIGLDSKGNIFLESISDFKKEKAADTAELLYAITNGLLNDDINKHLYNLIQEDPSKKQSILMIIKKLNSLNSAKDAPPLIDALQVMHE